MIFNLIYEAAINQIIKEGGNAFDDVVRIDRELIADTVESFKKTVLLPFMGQLNDDNVFLLGSTGKKKDSGDIDIGLDVNVLPEKNILINLMKLDEICSKNRIPAYINTINYSMLHVDFPQYKQNKTVQIDLLLTKYPEFTKFFMFSPAEGESKYKGAHRNALLKAILTATSINYIDYDNNGELVKWSQIDMDHTGISKTVKTLVDENGNRLLYKTTNEPLEFEYAKNLSNYSITHSVRAAIDMMFGPNYNEEDLESFEKVFQLMSQDNFKYADRLEDILKMAAKNLMAAGSRLEFPKELEEYKN